MRRTQLRQDRPMKMRHTSIAPASSNSRRFQAKTKRKQPHKLTAATWSHSHQQAESMAASSFSDQCKFGPKTS